MSAVANERAAVPWPRYCQWTLEIGPLGCLCVVLGVVATSLLSLWGVQDAWVHVLAIPGAVTALWLLPPIVITAVNAGKWFAWWLRVGRVTTWRGVGRIISADRQAYEVLGKTLFRGPASFGTYMVIGGWDAFVLRNKETGKLWVIWGAAPAHPEAHGIPVFVD
jgi:hypothetical protein